MNADATDPPLPTSVQATVVGGEIHLRAPYQPSLVARIRTLPGRRWDPSAHLWRLPDTPSVRQALRTILGVRVPTPAPPPEAAEPRSASDVEASELQIPPLPQPRREPPHPLLVRFDEEMRLRGYAPRTRKVYLGHARCFLRAADPHGDLPENLRAFVLHKLGEGGVSRSYHSQLISALRLFCSSVLGRSVEELPLERPRRDRRLPTVLSREELRRFLTSIRNPKHLALLAVAYSAGLRVGEAVRLRPGDLDRSRGLLLVRGGKGRKDRTTLLSRNALALVDAYLDGADPGPWLFPGARPGRPLSTRSVQKVTAAARTRAGISKAVTPHVLRHSFATHLLEGGTDVRLIQELLGHANVRTTEIYTHVSQRQIQRIRSPLDAPLGEEDDP